MSRSLLTCTNEDLVDYTKYMVKKQTSKFSEQESEEILSICFFKLTKAGFWERDKINKKARASYIRTAVKNIISDYVKKDERIKDYEESYDGIEFHTGLTILYETIWIDKIWIDTILSQLGPIEKELLIMCLANPTGWEQDAKKEKTPQYQIDIFKNVLKEIMLEQGVIE